MNNITNRLFSVIIFALSICTNVAKAQLSDDSIKALLVGDWKLVRGGYYSFDLEHCPTFYGNDTVDLRQEFYKRTNDTYRYFGSKTIYRVKKGMLGIYQLDKNKWEDYKVITINHGILKISRNKKDTSLYARQHYVLDTMPTFNQIVHKGWEGPCTVISSDGNVLFWDDQICKGSISKSKFEEIENNFRRADIKNIDSNFDEGGDDITLTYYTTFVKDGKLYKSIKEHGYAGTDELNSAYPSIEHLYSEIKRTPIDTFYNALIMYLGSFTDKKYMHILYPTEKFLLLNYLINGSKVDTTFNAVYIIKEKSEPGKFDNEHITEIVSDGRFYKISFKDKAPIIIDIGFNFVEKNSQALKFKN